MKMRTRLCAALGLMTAWPLVLAAPDAGQLLNEQQGLTPPAVKRPARPAADGAVQPADRGGFRALVRAVRFSGAEGLASEAELQGWVAASLGQSLSHGELQALAQGVSARLQAKGFLLARAYLPRQDLSAGELEIAIVPGRLQAGPGRVQVQATPALAGLRLREVAEAAIPDGPVRTDQLERALLLINDLPGVSARSSLDKGDQSGTSRLLIQADATPAWTASASADNFSNRYTGAQRLLAQASANNLLNPGGLGDVLGASLSASEGTTLLGLNYGLVLNPQGLRANLQASHLSYRIGLELAALGLRGTADTLGLGLSYPLLRGRDSNLWLQLDAERKQLRDDALGGNLRQRHLHRASATLSGSRWDSLADGGQTEVSVTATIGQLNLAGNPADLASDRASARTQGGFHKLGARLSRLQSLGAGGDWTALVSFNGQASARNLDSSEKFMLGGPGGVRAYAVGEASGDAGWLATAELRRDFTPFAQARGQLLGFIDSGRIQSHSQLWAGALPAGRANSLGLSGAGVGLNLYGERWALRSAWAHAVGTNAGRSAAGLDADGRASRQRLWVQATLRY